MSNETQPEKSYRNFLPWIITGVAFLFYLFTMARCVTLTNLGMVAELCHWNWPQNTLPPVVMIVTYPLRWLAVSAMPFGLGLFSAACGALTLGLLARCVMLLPHDRTQDQRDRERSEYSLLSIPAAWLPPVLAVFACGLQLTFWRNSVDGTGLIIDALLFAYPVRCLLEYRFDGRQSWLDKAALVFGLGMANHWLMVAFLPLFLLALLWIRGVAFFNPGFLVRMAVAGLAGTVFCLLLPLAQGSSVGSPQTLGETLQMYFAGQKGILVSIPLHSLWVLGLTSLLPMVILGIRWGSSFGDNSPLGVALARFMFHVVHGLFLLICIWGAFDSPLSPRVFSRQGEVSQFFAGEPWLPLYFLEALSVGYYSGYFLLVFNNQVRAARHESDFIRLVNSLLTVGVWVGLVLVPVGLLYKNLPSVGQLGGRLLSEYGRNLTKNLPANGAILLSDDATTLALARATLASSGNAQNFVFLNTAALTYPGYHEFLRSRQPKLWSGELAKQSRTNLIPVTTLIDLLARQSATREIYYLHPSFGYYFERFYAEPHGLAYRLQLYPKNSLLAPVMSVETAVTNTVIWKQLDETALPEVVRQLPPKHRTEGLAERILGTIHAKIEPDDQPILVGAYYSRVLNSWGAIQQAQRDLPGAGWSFKRALDLNPMNVVAEINLECNKSLRAGGYKPVDMSKGLADEVDQYRDPSLLLSINGPFDEPHFCYQEGAFFIRAAHYRQAAEQFERVRALMPEDPGAYVWLAQIYNLWQQPDEALALMKSARALPSARTNSPAEMVTVEATAYFFKKDVESAERVLQNALLRNPEDQLLENTVVSLLISFQRQTTALTIVDRRLRLSPDNLDALNNKGVINLQLGLYAAAIPPLDRLLELQPANYIALLNRAIALLQSDRLDDAKRDYDALATAFPTAYQAYYGLGEIAYRRKDVAAATTNYKLYLKYAPANSDEARTVQKRLDEMKANTP